MILPPLRLTLPGSGVTYNRLVVYLLPDELVLTQRVLRLTGDGVHGTLVHLLLDRPVQHEQGLSSALLGDG